MSSASHLKLFFLAATAAIIAVDPVSGLLISEPNHHVSRQQTLGRPSFVQLGASSNRSKYTELEKLTAKRLSIRRRRASESGIDVDVLAATSGEVVHQDHHASKTLGLEYLYESGEERHSDDLFHIILMPSSFQKDYMSVEYVAESCSEILGLRSDKAYDISLFAKHQGFSTLGTWTREECLSMGKQLLSRNLDCRVIPFHMGVEPDSTSPDDIIPASGERISTSRPTGAIDSFYLV